MAQMKIHEAYPRDNYKGNYTDDYVNGDGKYANKCRECERLFFGHKYRRICKLCQEKLININHDTNI